MQEFSIAKENLNEKTFEWREKTTVFSCLVSALESKVEAMKQPLKDMDLKVQ